MDPDALAMARRLVDDICACQGGECVWIDTPRLGVDATFLREQLAQAYANGSVIVLVGGDTADICRMIVVSVAAYSYATDEIAYAKPPPASSAVALVYEKRIVLGTLDEMIAQLYAMVDGDVPQID